MDEQLQSYKLKKLKSQFEYLRSELEEHQYIYGLALEKFYVDFTQEIDEEKVRNTKEEQKKDKAPKEKELIKLYHRIANKTHPDKLINKDITSKEKTNLETLYKEATVASAEHNYDDLVDIANKLGFDDVLESEHYLTKSINKLNHKLEFLKSTYAWVWYHSKDEVKPMLRKKILNLYKK